MTVVFGCGATLTRLQSVLAAADAVHGVEGAACQLVNRFRPVRVHPARRENTV